MRLLFLFSFGQNFTNTCIIKKKVVPLQRINKNKTMHIGTPEILLIAAIVLLLFGGKKIPELMRGLGKGVKSFKDGMKDEDANANANEKENEKK